MKMRKRKEEYTNLHEKPKIGKKKNVIKKRKDNLVILKIGSVVY